MGLKRESEENENAAVSDVIYLGLPPLLTSPLLSHTHRASTSQLRFACRVLVGIITESVAASGRHSFRPFPQTESKTKSKN